jgi:predicted phage terminase large subunit-like protein
MELDADTIQRLADRGRKSLFFFARAILGFAELDVEIHKPICDMLQDWEKNTRCLVELPRTWFKSTISSIAYPIWRAINDPNIRVLIAQNTYANACKKLSAIANIFEKNNLFRALYTEILPTRSCRWSGECLEINRSMAHPEGTFEAVGIGTTATSRHYDLIVQDDTISPKKDDMTGIVQQPTKLDIEKAIGWHNLCHPMLLHPKMSQILIVGTRWAERDLLGYIYENFPEYNVYRKTACEKDGEPRSLDDGGTPTWGRFDEETLRELEKSEGPYMFAALYLGTPTAAINQVFRRDWIRYFDAHPRESYACTSVDLASAEKEESSDPDFNVIITTSVEPKSGRVFVLEYTRERMSPSDVVDCIFRHYHKYHSIKFFVEAIGYQRTLIHWLKREQRKRNALFSIEEIRSYKQSKQERIRALQPYFANELVAMRMGMIELEQELLAFPKGAHDDLIDALSMQVGFWTEMMELAKIVAPEKKLDPFSGEAVIDELKAKFGLLNQYPYDMGNLDDRYLQEKVRSSVLRNEMRERVMRGRRDALFA